MEIARLPNEVLRLIFSLPGSSYALISLWKCGSGLLNHKLAHSVETILLEDANPMSTSRLPTMLPSLLCLRSVRILRNGALAPWTLLSEVVYSLPRTLRELEIRCVGAHLALAQLPPYSASTEPADVSSPTALRGITEQHLMAWNVKERFPALLKLVLLPFADDIKVSLAFSGHKLWSSIIARLPASIEYVGLSEVEAFEVCRKRDENCFPALHTLESESCSFQEDSVHLSIERHLGSSVRMPRSRSMLAFLRKHQNLKSVALILNDMEIDSPPDSRLESLSITCRFIMGDPMEKTTFPPRLTRFQSSTSIAITADRLKCLPRTITELLSINLDWSSLVHYHASMEGVSDAIPVQTLWPPQLRVLELEWSRVPDQESLCFFPSSLEKLTGVDLGEVTNGGYLSMRQIPLEWPAQFPKLRSLALMNGSLSFPNGISVYLTHLEMKIWTQEISTWTSLSTSSITTLKLWFASPLNTEKTSVNQLLSVLPTGLTSLNLVFVQCELDWDSRVDWSKLPAPLRAFNMHSDGIELEEDGEALGECWWLWSLKSHQILPYLPASLESLDISLSEVNASDILVMPCYDNLRWFSMAWAVQDGSSFVPSDEIADAWPFHADSSFDQNWRYGKVERFWRKLDAARQRGFIFPDPRVTSPGQAMKY